MGLLIWMRFGFTEAGRAQLLAWNKKYFVVEMPERNKDLIPFIQVHDRPRVKVVQVDAYEHARQTDQRRQLALLVPMGSCL